MPLRGFEGDPRLVPVIGEECGTLAELRRLEVGSPHRSPDKMLPS
jgi:hypothetical protein